MLVSQYLSIILKIHVSHLNLCIVNGEEANFHCGTDVAEWHRFLFEIGNFSNTSIVTDRFLQMMALVTNSKLNKGHPMGYL